MVAVENLVVNELELNLSVDLMGKSAASFAGLKRAYLAKLGPVL